ncbi:MAG: SDR family oxidoreductase [Pseudomonadota bacterium]
MAIAQDLAGRRAVVTGAGRGLGRAIAARLAAAGATVAALDVPDALAGAIDGAACHAIDLVAPDADKRLRDIAQEVGAVDIVVANAGAVPPWRGVEALDRAEWDRVMTLNTWAVAETLGAFAPGLGRSAHASAIVMASINGYRAHPKQVLYTASKHAVIGIMRAAALDLGQRGIRVNALAPGPIATDALMDRLARRHATGGPSPGDGLAAMAGETALGRMATEADVANAAHFLASDASSAMTGLVLPVEAGLS